MKSDESRELDLVAAGRQLDWKTLASYFRVISGREILAMKEMERHQNIRDKVRWLEKDEQPLALLFVSHRWETPQHPDPRRRHLESLREFLRRICICVEAMLVQRQERLNLVPDLAFEGTLQAEEVARRILGFGPFSMGPACGQRRDARKMIDERFRYHQDSRAAFRDWLMGRIGVWLDYLCMPQKPLAPDEEPEFRRCLGAIDSLVMSSTLIALRDIGDDYPLRGWCASEFFLASEHSFSRSLFIDTRRLEKAERVAIAHAPASISGEATSAAKIMTESYEQDLGAFHESCKRWSSSEGSLLEITPPDAWSAYRSLQGSSFFAPEFDPNPSRRALEAIRSMETALIDKWLMSDKPRLFDLGMEMEIFLRRLGLRCTERTDLAYLGFLLACHGWIDAFRPLFRECLKLYLKIAAIQPSRITQDSSPKIIVALKPIAEDVRALFSAVRPSSPGTWNSRLSTGPGPDPRERAVIEKVRSALHQNPPEFTFVNLDDPQFSRDRLEHLA